MAGLAVLFLASGALHLLRPQVFEAIVPPALPARRTLVHASGVLEILCAAGLLHPRTRPVAGLASAALLVAVFPANLQMSLVHGRRAWRTRRPSHMVIFGATLARLPLQWPLIRTARRAAN